MLHGGGVGGRAKEERGAAGGEGRWSVGAEEGSSIFGVVRAVPAASGFRLSPLAADFAFCFKYESEFGIFHSFLLLVVLFEDYDGKH